MTDGLTVALSVDALGPNLTGIGRYCLELAERLPAKLGPDRTRYFRGSDWIDDHRELLNDGWSPKRLNPLRRRLLCLLLADGRWRAVCMHQGRQGRAAQESRFDVRRAIRRRALRHRGQDR